MKTKRTLSNISYNTRNFFTAKICDLYNRGIIDWAHWIVHEPDTDEKKQHIHFVLSPSSRIDTKDLEKEFTEFDPNNPKPRRVLTIWHPENSLDDWFLYGMHHPGYLASKGQRRNIKYDLTAFKSTDEDAMRAEINSIDMTKFNRLTFIQDAVECGLPFHVLVQEGYIPIAQRAQYEFQYNALMAQKMANATGRKIDHEEQYEKEQNEVDPSTTLPIRKPKMKHTSGQIDGFDEIDEDIPF